MKYRLGACGIAAILIGLGAPAAGPRRCGKRCGHAQERARHLQAADRDQHHRFGGQHHRWRRKPWRKRLLDAGFPKADVVVLGPNDRKGNMVARYRGKPGSKLKPMLIIGTLDVVEARREDWSTDPFQFVEKDGYFYGRGTQDMKDSDAIAVTDFIRMKKEGFVPDRDIILALTADEENGKSNGVDWLLKNHRELIDAEFALESGRRAACGTDKPQIVWNSRPPRSCMRDYQVLATNPGGHSSLPIPDNAIYHVANALAALAEMRLSLSS